MADSGTKYLDLSFIETDIRNQLGHSKAILDQVGMLQRIADATTTDSQTRVQIEGSIRRLLEIAKGLSENAITTSSSTSALVGPMVPRK